MCFAWLQRRVTCVYYKQIVKWCLWKATTCNDLLHWKKNVYNFRISKLFKTFQSSKRIQIFLPRSSVTHTIHHSNFTKVANCSIVSSSIAWSSGDSWRFQKRKKNISHRIHGTWYMSLHWSHKNQPTVGKYTIHGSYGFLFWANFELWKKDHQILSILLVA